MKSHVAASPSRNVLAGHAIIHDDNDRYTEYGAEHADQQSPVPKSNTVPTLHELMFDGSVR